MSPPCFCQKCGIVSSTVLTVPQARELVRSWPKLTWPTAESIKHVLEAMERRVSRLGPGNAIEHLLQDDSGREYVDRVAEAIDTKVDLRSTIGHGHYGPLATSGTDVAGEAEVGNPESMIVVEEEVLRLEIQMEKLDLATFAAEWEPRKQSEFRGQSQIT